MRCGGAKLSDPEFLGDGSHERAHEIAPLIGEYTSGATESADERINERYCGRFSSSIPQRHVNGVLREKILHRQHVRESQGSGFERSQDIEGDLVEGVAWSVRYDHRLPGFSPD